jgi:vitamin-K-epoxide reductase (warfarin-sensitive)
MILSLLGFLISFYAFFVERQLQQSKTYRPFCDINQKISCSRVFLSKEGHLLGISNTSLGVFFYAFFGIFLLLEYFFVLFLLAIFAVLGSLYLLYLQLVKLRIFCVVCTLLYLINMGLLMLLFMSL